MPDKVKSEHFNIQNVLRYIENGEWGLPSFQRSFVWTESDIKLLLDSIFHDYPCGVLLIMPYEKNLAGRPFEGSHAKEVSEYLVLDGQQRLTSCYNVFYNKGRDYKDGTKVYYYLDLERLYRKCKGMDLSQDDRDLSEISLIDDDDSIIVTRRRKTAPDNIEGDLVPFFMLKNDATFSRYFKAYLENSNKPKEMKDFLDTYLRTLIAPFSNFTLQSLELSKNMGLSAVCRIFETLNNTGIKLDSFDICVAKYMADCPGLDLKKELDHSLDEQSTLRPLFLKNPEKKESFKNREVILQTMALSKGCDHRKNALANSLKGMDVSENWDQTIECLVDTVSILNKYAQTESTMDLVPYSVTIPVIAATLMKIGYPKMKKTSQAKAEQKIIQYFFYTAFNERYADGAPGKMGKDCSALCEWILNDNPPDEKSCFSTNISIDIDTLKGIGKNSKGAIALALRCIYLSQNPQDFYKDKPVELKTSNLHHLFPLNYYGDVDSILNLAYLEGSSNASIGDKSVETYTDEIIGIKKEDGFKQVLKSHFITGDTYESYRHGNYEGFIQGRFDEIIAYMKQTMNLNVNVGGTE